MTDEQKVDPRYDPAFQRGYEGTVSSVIRTRTRAPERSAIVSPAPYRPAAPEPEAADAEAVVEPDPAMHSASPEPAPAARPTMREFVRNPFVVLLLLLGLGMIVGGGAWANQARALVAARGGASTELDYWFLQATVVSAPLTILAGIGILAGVMFLAARAWGRR